MQRCVVLSIIEPKLIAITEACKECIWLKKLLQEICFFQDKYLLFCDSQGVIHLGKNSTFHNRFKNIDVRYHWIQDLSDVRLLELDKVHIYNGVHIMTKALPIWKFETFYEIVG